MAELHGRIRGLPHSAIAVLVVLAAGTARAQDPSALDTDVGELRASAEALGSADAGARAQAVRVLSTLEDEALPAIRARIAELRPLDSDAAYDALGAFRHALGSRRADDMIDIAPGVPQVLAEHRDRVTVAVAERVLLLRSLEAMGGLPAGRAMADLLALNTHAWRWEMKRVVERMGRRALPALVVARSHEDRGIRAWARGSIEALGMSQPGLAVQAEVDRPGGVRAGGAGAPRTVMDDRAFLADLLRAYGEIRDMDAMPVVVSFTTHERSQVRDAARWATEQYGQNAIWQLRRVYRTLTEEDADRSWGWRRTMDALYAAADAQRLAPVRADLDAGNEALARGDLDAMRARYEAVLRAAPGLAGRDELAPGFARLAKRELDADRLDEAALLYRRAVRLAPAHPEARRWQADLAFIEGEQRLAAGVVDLPSYERAVALAPDHARAREAIATLTGSAAAERASTRRWAALAAALLLAIAAFVVLRRRRPDHPAVDGAPDTVPG